MRREFAQEVAHAAAGGIANMAQGTCPASIPWQGDPNASEYTNRRADEPARGALARPRCRPCRGVRFPRAGTAHDDSDIDLLVEFAEGRRLFAALIISVSRAIDPSVPPDPTPSAPCGCGVYSVMPVETGRLARE